ncbi:MAG: hypothetical protein Q9168_003939 [Polycauliona sp. 1 TL-2023]
MRLINTATYEIQEFSPANIPPYAILSHTWGEDEYIFGDRNNPDRRKSAGFKKVSGCCALAASQGFSYVWIDTCCIDKTSSAELTESINSMYKWYQQSHICYAYLADIHRQASQIGKCKFHESRWFQRGWTLQELLAPDQLIFYDFDWIEIGSRSTLKTAVSKATGISTYHLSYPQEASVAAKMSWASHRQTTREEDIAYSLLGLFMVNMPLMYGEGKNAFFRLQCEIIQSSSDESIFAWRDPAPSVFGVPRSPYSGLLASSPEEFEGSGDIVPIHLDGYDRPPYSLTNQGMSIELRHEGFDSEPLDDLNLQVLMRQNRDSRLKGGRSVYGDQFSSDLACARESKKHAPVVLTFQVVYGRLAIRIRCDEIFFKRGKVSETELHEEVHLIGHQRMINDVLPEQTQPTSIELTSAFHELFVLDRERSKKYTITEDGSIIVSHHRRYHGRSWKKDDACLYFEADSYSFMLHWYKPQGPDTHQTIRFYESPNFDGKDLKDDLEYRFNQPTSGQQIQLYEDIVRPIEDTHSLCISTRKDPKFQDRRIMFTLDVTTIDPVGTLDQERHDSPPLNPAIKRAFTASEGSTDSSSLPVSFKKSRHADT